MSALYDDDDDEDKRNKKLKAVIQESHDHCLKVYAALKDYDIHALSIKTNYISGEYHE